MSKTYWPVETTKVFEGKIKVKANNGAKVLEMLEALGVEVEDLMVLPCDHKWVQYKTFQITKSRPVGVEVKWYDIPNGHDGDYVEVTARIGWDMVGIEEEVPDSEHIICSICGAETEDGLCVS